jgi:hypothetical protein
LDTNYNHFIAITQGENVEKIQQVREFLLEQAEVLKVVEGKMEYYPEGGGRPHRARGDFEARKQEKIEQLKQKTLKRLNDRKKPRSRGDKKQRSEL